MENAVLLVDDDRNLLSSYQRMLRNEFNIIVAAGGRAGLDSIVQNGSFAVIVSDLRMPEMDGVEFLSKVKRISPKSVRIMLTGNADIDTAIQVVNEGNIFRFLTKPCPPEMLINVIQSGIEQYRLVMAEKELLEKTLSGSIKVLTDILALINPRAFSHSSRVRRIVRRIAAEMKIENSWQVEIAAMLSQLGCVTIPDETMNRVINNEPLSDDEARMYNNYPKIGAELIANIPRLEHIKEIIKSQEFPYDGSTGEFLKGDDILVESRILKVALDYDICIMSGLKEGLALVELHKKISRYDPGIVAILERLINNDENCTITTLRVEDLADKMIVAEDIVDRNGTLLVARGQEITKTMRIKLMNFKNTLGVNATIKVILVKE